MRRKHTPDRSSSGNASSKRSWEKKDNSESLRGRWKKELMTTEGIALYALLRLAGRKDDKGVPLSNQYGIWNFVREELGADRFSPGVLRHALYRLLEKGVVIYSTPTTMPELKSVDLGVRITTAFYEISGEAQPEKIRHLMQQAKEDWEREKKLSGKD